MKSLFTRTERRLVRLFRKLLNRHNFHLKAEMFSFHSKYFVYRELKRAPQKLSFCFKCPDTGTVRILGNILYSMSFLSLAQFSLHLCPGLNSARKFTKVANFHDDLAKITKYRKSAIFRDVLAKTAKFTIFMIFPQTLRQNCQNSSPFVILMTTHPQSGAADFTI